MRYEINDQNQKMITLKELRTSKGLSGNEMAQRLDMPLDEYYRAENGKPPKWMLRAVHLFNTVFEDGYLPSQLKLAENPKEYKAER